VAADGSALGGVMAVAGSTRPSLVLSTVGTSVLVKLLGDQPELVTYLRQTDLPREVAEVLQAAVAERAPRFLAADLGTARELSAEVNGLLAWYGGVPPPKGDHQVLLVSDTWQGATAADLVRRWLEGHGASVEVLPIRDLAATDATSFHWAAAEVGHWCAETLPGYRDRGYRVVFHLTGGFKAMAGYLTALGLWHADEVVFQFEGAEDLLRIPRLPAATWPDAAAVVRAHLGTLRRLAVLGEVDLRAEEVAALPDALVVPLGRPGVPGRYALSVWGQVVWEAGRSKVYRERLWPSPHKRVRYGPGFVASVDAGGRYLEVNTRVDDLVQWAERGVRRSRLDVKKLAVPQGPSTHECDAWADQAAWRVYLHQDGATWVLDRLGPKL